MILTDEQPSYSNWDPFWSPTLTYPSGECVSLMQPSGTWEALECCCSARGYVCEFGKRLVKLNSHILL